METIKEMLRFLNVLDSADKLDIDYLEKLVEIEKMIVREFEDYKTSKMIYALDIIDEIRLS